ncbi:MAG: glycosyltransferase family 4 protein [Bacteroidales bacterium]|nr:glycosyltransferase family 4 protein [Bacteroidales bacterium]
MRIAILLLNKGRGSGEVAREHVKHLLTLGHTVYFLYPGNTEGVDGAVNIDIQLHTHIYPVHEYLPSAGVDQKQVARMSAGEMSSYARDYELALETIAGEVDIFIGHHANVTAVAVHRIAKKYNKPYVLFVHGTGIEPRHHGLWDDDNWKLIEEAILHADGILVTTEYVREVLVKPLVNLPDNRFLILPCGVDMEAFKPHQVGNVLEKYKISGDYVICPGALTYSKGPQNVVEASSYYTDLATTIFLGDGELEGELKLALGDRGRFLGFVSSEDKAYLINGAAILTAAPEKLEHFGIIYAEALAGGVPVVAYAGGGVDSIITPQAGILTERNPEILGKTIRHLLQDVALRNQMSEYGRKRAEQHYDYNTLVKKLAHWLQGFL